MQENDNGDKSDHGPYKCHTVRGKVTFPGKTLRCGNALTLQISLSYPDVAQEGVIAKSAPLVVFLSGFQVCGASKIHRAYSLQFCLDTGHGLDTGHEFLYFCSVGSRGTGKLRSSVAVGFM